jgi:AcrR family transcriptional regulator
MTATDRRGAIIDAALAVAMRKGLAATTVRDVAAEMSSSSGLIHHYFGSMDEVLAAAFSKVADADLDATRVAMARSDTPTGRLSAFFTSYAATEDDHTFQLWLDAWSEASRNPAIRATSRALNIEWQSLLRGVIADGVAVGEFLEVDPDATAWKTLSLLDGLSLQVVAHRTVIDRQVAVEWAANSTERDLGLRLGTLTAPASGDDAGEDAGEERADARGRPSTAPRRAVSSSPPHRHRRS